MKNYLLLRTNKLIVKIIFSSILFLFLINFSILKAQVNFVQTLNADFNKGVLNNAVVASDNIYLQFAANDVGSWLTTTVLPQTLSGHKTVSWNDRYVYMVGGYNNINYVNTVYVASIQAGGISGWTTLNPLPVALRDPAVVIGTNTIYVMGGRDGSQVYNTIYYASINSDGTIGAWQTSAVTLPVNLWGHTATYMMGYIYIIGGSSSMTENTALNTVYFAKVNALNTISTFTPGTNLAAARNRHSTITYNNKLYVLGGYDNSGIKANSVYIATPALNGSNGIWTSGSNLPVAISNHSAVVNNGMITVMAGAVASTLSNAVYYAKADTTTLAWITSGNVLYDYTKDGAAYSGNGIVFYTGGTNLSGTPTLNCRYANMNITSNYVNHGSFISNPFSELGAERLIDSLSYLKSYTAPANIQLTYRTAASDGIWGDWNTLSTSSPIIIGQTKQYLQYATILTGLATLNATFNELKMYTPGTQLSGNLNSINTFTKALSPYWATSDISFTAGTHTFQAGATILFLPNTGLTVSQANIICNGSAVDTVKFTYFTNETGKWNGIYFDENSDIGVSSQFNYTVISNAGNGSRNANLSCYATSEPLLSNCIIRNADGNGISLNSAHISIQNSLIKGNTENGLYLTNSNPSVISTISSYNGSGGVCYATSSSLPNFTNTTLSYNLYAIFYPSVNITLTKHLGNLTLTNNTYNGICLPGGYVTDNNRWNSLAYPIFIMDNLYIGKNYDKCRLTIEPGNTIKMALGKKIQIGHALSGWYSGELYAIGSLDSVISFTAINGTAGGWEGIYFNDYSDYNGATSIMDYCVIEKGNEYNMYIENTYQPSLNHCTVKNAFKDGIKFYGAYNTISNSTIQSNGRYPLFYSEPHTFPTLNGNTYSGNTINMIGYCGGSLTESRTFQNDGIGYHIMDNIMLGRGYSLNRLTIEPGVTLSFASGKNIQIGYYASGWYAGELYAVGTIDSIITFTSYSGVAGDWNGIYFHDYSDYSGGISQMKYCTIQKSSAYNVYCENTTTVSIDNCSLSNALTDGLRYYGSTGSFTNNTFNNNGRYPVFYTEWSSQPTHFNNTFTANGINMIALSGGTYSESRLITKDNTDYLILDNILIASQYSTRRLTINPGVTLNFVSGKNLQVGYYNPSSGWFGGELYAVGKADSIITFAPYSGIIGDWNGINFDPRSSNAYSGSTSLLKYCTIKKGNTYNVLAESTQQPTIDHCTFTQSTGNGLVISNSNLSIRNSSFYNNASNGIYVDGTGTTTLGNADSLTCNLYNNGSFALYNNSASDINARNNFWGSSDSTMISLKIYDKGDNSAKGRVYFSPFLQLPSLLTTSTLMSGNIKYANIGANPIKNAAMVIKNFSDSTIATTSSNSSGLYTFSSFSSGNYKMNITPTAAWSGVNSTDALLILNHFAQITPLTGIYLAAADVNNSHSINGTDAMFVMRRYSGLITSFPAGDYLYNTDSISVNGNQVTNNLKMICYGDVNASYAPAKKSSSSTGFIHEGSFIAESFTEYDFPVRLKSGMQVAAASLGFYYPEQYVEILNAQLVNGVTGFSWTANNGLFRMAWCDMNAININNDGILVILRIKTKNLIGITADINFDIYENTEFANTLAIPNEFEIVSIPTIKVSLNGIQQMNNFYSLSVYPNPVSANSVISFSMKEPGTIHLSLVDILGKNIMDIVNSNYSSGNHNLALNTSNLSRGIYFLKLTNSNKNKEITETIKLVVSN
ncbi:MAG: Kelch repeat-containing protein [Bacteroidales bacterium]